MRPKQYGRLQLRHCAALQRRHPDDLPAPATPCLPHCGRLRLAGLLVGWFTFRSLAVVIAADIFLPLLLLLLVSIPRLTADYLKRHAAREDHPVWIIFAVTLATVIVAVISLFLLINQAPSPDPLRLALTLVSLPLGWFTIHTMAALHYAHLYWQPAARPGEDEALDGDRRPRRPRSARLGRA